MRSSVWEGMAWSGCLLGPCFWRLVWCVGLLMHHGGRQVVGQPREGAPGSASFLAVSFPCRRSLMPPHHLVPWPAPGLLLA